MHTAISMVQGLAVEDWLDRPLDELQERIAHLPARTLVFYLLLFSDGHGAGLTPFEAARRLAERSSAPIFSPWESIIGSGVVGGHVLSQVELGRTIGLNIVATNSTGALPNVMRFVYDWPELVRWSLDDAALPADAIILNRPPGLIEQYRWQVTVVVAFTAALSALSLFLAHALRLRNRAVRELAAEREALTERVRERTEELARSNAELEQFAYAISHDLRQPLRMVSSYVSLLARRLADHLDADGRRFVEFAVGGAKRMDGMILSLLDYSRLGRQGEAPAWTDSRHCLDEALSFLKPAIDECGAEVVVSGDWPRVFVMPDAFERVLLNLIGNAVKYRAAEVVPRIEVTAGTSDEGWVFSVRDNGIGIDPEEVSKLFRVFQRLARAEIYDGSGVGLALCRRLVEMQGGRIWMESDGIGKGSVFRFTVPPGSDSDTPPA